MLVELVHFIAVDYRARYQMLNSLVPPHKHLKSTVNNKNNALRGNVQNINSTNYEQMNLGRIFAHNVRINSEPIQNIYPHNVFTELDEEKKDKVDTKETIKKMCNERKAKIMTEEILELKERFNTELIAVETLKRLIQDLNKNHVQSQH